MPALLKSAWEVKFNICQVSSSFVTLAQNLVVVLTVFPSLSVALPKGFGGFSSSPKLLSLAVTVSYSTRTFTGEYPPGVACWCRS
eukprot:CAMPEP_0198685798 /NCGR_PEP_ID=MMETSP1468-20131203/14115_1 /TAXON_ID=1461545 /ORGANISM="Mantoniella sp, Strain CCMP1436" /LENGTH=84 /DNA_ID=CAMNT_0044431499 /DNA_START=1855 /DNA_END=2109 /DNA_ORIENTATION=+